jgi:hypothetical protein
MTEWPTEWPKIGLIMFQIQFICTFVVSIFIKDHSGDILHNLCIGSEQLQCEQISRLCSCIMHVFVMYIACTCSLCVCHVLQGCLSQGCSQAAYMLFHCSQQWDEGICSHWSMCSHRSMLPSEHMLYHC